MVVWRWLGVTVGQALLAAEEEGSGQQLKQGVCVLGCVCAQSDGALLQAREAGWVGDCPTVALLQAREAEWAAPGCV